MSVTFIASLLKYVTTVFSVLVGIFSVLAMVNEDKENGSGKRQKGLSKRGKQYIALIIVSGVAALSAQAFESYKARIDEQAATQKQLNQQTAMLKEIRGYVATLFPIKVSIYFTVCPPAFGDLSTVKRRLGEVNVRQELNQLRRELERELASQPLQVEVTRAEGVETKELLNISLMENRNNVGSSYGIQFGSIGAAIVKSEPTNVYSHEDVTAKGDLEGSSVRVSMPTPTAFDKVKLLEITLVIHSADGKSLSVKLRPLKPEPPLFYYFDGVIPSDAKWR